MHVAVTGASSGLGEAFSEALREEIRGTGVHVLTAYPGMTDTPMTQGGLEAYGRTGLVARIPLGDAAAFARGLRRAVERRKKRFIYPGFYVLARWFPRISTWLSARLAPRVGTAPKLVSGPPSQNPLERTRTP